MFLTLIETLVGEVPVGYEVVAWIAACAVAAMVVRGVLGIFTMWRRVKF